MNVIINPTANSFPGTPGVYDAAAKGLRFDDGTIFTARDLEFIETAIMETETQPLEGQNLVASVSTVPGFNKTITAKRRLRSGKATFIGIGGVATKINQVDQSVTETSWRQTKLAIAASWDDDELAASRAANPPRPLDTSSALDAAEVLNDTMDDFKFVGEADLDLRGFFDDKFVDQTRSTYGINDSFTPEVILAGLHADVNSIAEDTNTVERPNRLCLSLRAMHYLTTTRMAADSDTTIMTAFLSTNTYISNISQVFPMVKLNNVVTKGATLGETLVVTTFNPSKAQVNEIPPLGMQVQRIALAFLVIFVSYISEVQHRTPKSSTIRFDTNRGV